MRIRFNHRLKYGALYLSAVLTVHCSADVIDSSRLPWVSNADRTAEQVATDVIIALSDNDIESVVNALNGTLQESMSVNQVREIWPGLVLTHGGFVGVEEVAMSTSSSHDVALVACKFEEATVHFEVHIDSDLKVAALVRRYNVTGSP